MGDLIDRITADQWTAPTPCTEWNVRDLVNHLVGMNLVFVAMLEESPMPERGADRLGADPAGAYHRSAAALQAAAVRPGVLERSRATQVGVATGAERLSGAPRICSRMGGTLSRPPALRPTCPTISPSRRSCSFEPSCPANRAPDDSPIRGRSETTHPPSTGWRHSPAGQFRGPHERLTRSRCIWASRMNKLPVAVWPVRSRAWGRCGSDQAGNQEKCHDQSGQVSSRRSQGR